MRKTKKSGSERTGSKKRSATKPASPRAQAANAPMPAAATAGMLPSPPQHAPMQRDYLRMLIGKEGRPTASAGDGRQHAGNYATRLLTFAIRNRRI